MNAHRSSPDRLQSVESKHFETEDLPCLRPTDRARTEPSRQRSDAVPPNFDSGKLPVRASGSVRADVAVPSPRLDIARRNAFQTTPSRPDSAPPTSTRVAHDARHSASAAPFRLTVTEIGGEIAIALRMPHARPEEQDMFESQTRHAIGRYGLRTAILFINGVDRQIDAAGKSKHDD